MRYFPIVLFTVFLFALPVLLFAQNTPDTTPAPDDEFNLFLFTFAVAFLSLILGGAIFGAMAATLIVCGLFAPAISGVMTASIIVGLYKKSFAAGFKTFLLIICGTGGIVAGTIGFLLINHLFKLHMAQSTAAWSGAAGGLLGGLLLGICLSVIIRTLTAYFRERLSAC